MTTAAMQVMAYDSVGHKARPYLVRPGTEAEWKRKGEAGSYRVRILGVKGNRARVQMLEDNYGFPMDGEIAWVKARFLRIHEGVWTPIRTGSNTGA